MSVSVSPLAGVRRWLVVLMLLALVGAADAGYLLWWHRHVAADVAGVAGSAFCPARGCEIVNQGEFASVRGVPVAAIGLIGYLTILTLSLLTAIRGDRRAVQAIVILSGVGVIVSAYLIYLQIAVIEAICSYCILSAITMLSILVVALTLLGKPGLSTSRNCPTGSRPDAREVCGPASGSGAGSESSRR